MAVWLRPPEAFRHFLPSKCLHQGLAGDGSVPHTPSFHIPGLHGMTDVSACLHFAGNWQLPTPFPSPGAGTFFCSSIIKISEGLEQVVRRRRARDGRAAPACPRCPLRGPGLPLAASKRHQGAGSERRAPGWGKRAEGCQVPPLIALRQGQGRLGLGVAAGWRPESRRRLEEGGRARRAQTMELPPPGRDVPVPPAGSCAPGSAPAAGQGPGRSCAGARALQAAAGTRVRCGMGLRGEGAL